VRAELHRGPIDLLLPEWAELFRHDRKATPFSSAGWAQAWWRHWAGDAQPWVVTVRDGVLLTGLAALVTVRRGPLEVLAELGRPPSNYWDVLSLPDARAGVLDAVARTLAERRADWHALLLGGVRDGDELAGALRNAGLRVRMRKPAAYPGMDLPGSFEQYLADLPRKRRKDLRRHMRRLDEGHLELREVHGADELRRAVGRWQEIRVRWWNSRNKAMDPEHASTRFRDFMSDVVVALEPSGLAQVWEFSQDGEVVGVEVNLMDAERYYSWMGAYDPEVAHLGLGKLAIGESIRASIEAGRSYYDLMVGDEEYKYWYGATDRHCRWMTAANARPVSLAAFAGGAVVDRIRGL
jgi:CelD/BcsL family acetyltransferase involved in cellulose biosynthesis